MGLFSLVTSIIGGNKQKKAAKKAAQVTQDVADKNNALALNIYGKNEGYLAPYAQMGNQASGAIMELLGFAPTQQPPQNALTPQAGTQYGGQFGGALLDGGQNFLPNGYYYGQQTAQPVAQTPPAPQPTAMSAFDRYRASDGYQFRQNEGMNALASNFRGRGVSQSGAADKALLRYGQDYGSNEFGKYLGYLSNQKASAYRAHRRSRGLARITSTMSPRTITTRAIRFQIHSLRAAISRPTNGARLAGLPTISFPAFLAAGDSADEGPHS